MDENKLTHELFLGFIKIHILHHANKEEIFGMEFQKELSRHGYEISFGSLYPIFHKLEKARLIKSRKENVSGKIRKYYSITDMGKKVLEQSKVKARELFEELNE